MTTNSVPYTIPPCTAYAALRQAPASLRGDPTPPTLDLATLAETAAEARATAARIDRHEGADWAARWAVLDIVAVTVTPATAARIRPGLVLHQDAAGQLHLDPDQPVTVQPCGCGAFQHRPALPPPAPGAFPTPAPVLARPAPEKAALPATPDATPAVPPSTRENTDGLLPPAGTVVYLHRAERPEGIVYRLTLDASGASVAVWNGLCQPGKDTGRAQAIGWAKRLGYPVVRLDKPAATVASKLSDTPRVVAEAALQGPTAPDALDLHSTPLPPAGAVVYFRTASEGPQTVCRLVTALDTEVWQRTYASPAPATAKAQAGAFAKAHGYTLTAEPAPAPAAPDVLGLPLTPAGEQPQPSHTRERRAERRRLSAMEDKTLHKVARTTWKLDPDDYPDRESLIEAIATTAYGAEDVPF